MSTKSRSHLVWIDLETTGLDPQVHAILEIATLITDKDLNVIAQGPALVIHQPEEILAAMDPWARKQHESSGLLAEVRSSRASLAQAEAETLAFLSAHVPPRACPLCGSSICLDRRFLLRHMPQVSAHLSYRLVDVSSIKELVARWYPEKLIRRRRPSPHRALPDILGSLAELRYYREQVFRLPVSIPG
ncbi:TPA: oligoribonuclease [Candidatus Bipolaricaulota bacterium]|nr:oligoribonuclease [Candidatus Bipolaricaulota bacterium]